MLGLAVFEFNVGGMGRLMDVGLKPPGLLRAGGPVPGDRGIFCKDGVKAGISDDEAEVSAPTELPAG